MNKIRLISFFSVILISIGLLNGQENKSYLSVKNLKKINGTWLLYSANLTGADGSFNRFEFNSNQEIDNKDLNYINKNIDSYIRSLDYKVVSSGKGEMEFISFSKQQHHVLNIGYIIVKNSSKEEFFMLLKFSDYYEMAFFEITNVNKKFDKLNFIHRDHERVSLFQFCKID